MTVRSPSLGLVVTLCGTLLLAALLAALLFRPRGGGLQPRRGLAPLELDEAPPGLGESVGSSTSSPPP
jgi:hypothetical protein